MAKPSSQSLHGSSTPTQDDIILKDLRAKYEEAVVKQNEAKARLTRLSVKEAQHAETDRIIGRAPGVAVERQRHLNFHLENLRLQKRYRNLRLLSQYAEQADQIASDEGIFDDQESIVRSVTDTNDADQQAALVTTQRRLETLHDDAKSRTNDLEIDLVRARQQLKLEHNLLDKARNRTGTSGSDFHKQRAMEATRDELQNWIAESLARCEREIHPPRIDFRAAKTADVEQSEDEDEAAIDHEYEQYLEVRLRLVQMAKTLKTLVKDSSMQLAATSTTKNPTEMKPVSEDLKQRPPVQRAPHLRHKSRISIHKSGEQNGGPNLTNLESGYLPRYHHEKMLNTHMAYLEAQNTAQDARLLQGLGLLSHESHLLPSYPLSSTESTKKDRLKDPNQQQLDIEHLLGAWGHASDTAEGVLRGSVIGNIDETREALDSARQNLEEIQIMEDIRKEVAMNRV